MSVLFVDCESTGLDPRIHVPWEVAIVEPDGTAHVWCWRPIDAILHQADDFALDVGGFRKRAPSESDIEAEWQAAEAIAELTEGNILIGSKPSFDMEMLTPWLRFWGFEPRWHHRPVCVATMAYGWLHGQAVAAGEVSATTGEAMLLGTQTWAAAEADLTLPWKSDELSRACGVDPDDDERHTALGDARWVGRLYRHLTGGMA